MDMQTIVNRNLLTYAVGQAMFCPLCKAVLDCRRAVHVDIAWDGGATQFTACAPCFDSKREQITLYADGNRAPSSQPGVKGTLDILDGRELFGRRKAVRHT